MCDQKANVQFVEEVRKHPLLYNTSLPEYARRDLTEAAWQEVGYRVNLTGAACKEKWKNLRTVYSRHVRRSLEEPFEKRKKYYLMKHMEFVLPYMKPGAMVALNSNDAEDGCSSAQQNQNSYKNQESIHQESLEDSSVEEDNIIFPLVTIKTEDKYQGAYDGMDVDEKSGNRGPERDTDAGKFSHSHSTRTTEEPGNPLHVNHTLEVRRMFLLGLLDEVGMMTDAQMRSFKREVLKLIDDVLES